MVIENKLPTQYFIPRYIVMPLPNINMDSQPVLILPLIKPIIRPNYYRNVCLPLRRSQQQQAHFCPQCYTSAAQTETTTTMDVSLPFSLDGRVRGSGALDLWPLLAVCV